ncbi:MAG: aminotransferase class IV [Rhodobiaceae bacterium]|nr:aminotransferase class IV [Rhodobiaceae bacterium]MCC0051525.1 aminotransferase class IV [Rhodobiaceae bacterium]MCC0061026.1 aminotransferase class IV [Rhodobiaceae bacterium]
MSELQFPPGAAFIDGGFAKIEDAKISVLDWGFLRSDATYDVVHVWKGRFFRLDAHLDRFLSSAEKLRMKLPYDRAQIAEILAELVERTGFEDAYVEMIVTRGVSPTFSRDPRDAINRFIAFAIPFGWILRPEEREEGLALAVSEIPRIPPESVDPTVKNYHWLDLVMGMFDAYEQGARTCILTDGQGNITEGPGFNVFVVKDGKVATPMRGVLHGITRQASILLLQELQVPVSARPVSLHELREADEVFATSTAGGVMPVTKIGAHIVAGGKPGPITGRLIEAYWAAHTRDDGWSVAVKDVARGNLRG